PAAPPPAPRQRNETGNSVRSNAVKPGFQSVAEAASASAEAASASAEVAPPPAAAPPPASIAPFVPGFAGVTDCPDLAAAVAAGYRWAQPDGIVLLSPAAPSFGLFKDYRDRAEAFARAVRALPNPE